MEIVDIYGVFACDTILFDGVLCVHVVRQVRSTRHVVQKLVYSTTCVHDVH